MAQISNEIIEGIDELNCDENISKTMKEVLNKELIYYKDKNKTKKEIIEEYKQIITNIAEED